MFASKRKQHIVVGLTKFVTFVFFISLLLTGCKGKTSDITIQPSPVASLEPSSSPMPTPPNNFVIPQRGQRPIAVMIDNQGTKVLPQGGLNRAQVIYEILAEGGITRYMAVFWGNTKENIGPVRSSRHYYVQYAKEHDAIYVHFGWSPQAQSAISRLKVNNVNGLYASGAFWKMTQDRYNWQDKYTSMKRIKQYTKKWKYSTKTSTDLTFEYNPIMTRLRGKVLKDATQLVVNYNWQANNKYVYDKKTKLYKRYRNGSKHMDRNSKKQLTAGNIIIQYVPSVQISGDRKNRLDLKNTGSGEGWYITCGKAVKIKWSKASETSKTVYKRLSGKPLVLNPAQTWIQVVPPGVDLRMSGPAKAKKSQNKSAGKKS